MKKNIEYAEKGRLLREIREALDITREDFARLLGCSYRTLQGAELGHQTISRKVLKKAEELKKSGIVGKDLVAACSSNGSGSAIPARMKADEEAQDETDHALMRLFHQLGPVERAEVLVEVSNRVKAKNGCASGAPPGAGCESSAKAC